MKTQIKQLLLAACFAGGIFTAHAQLNTNGITNVIYILLENRNWSQNEYSYGEQILGSTNDAPFLNSLVDSNNANSAQVSFCSCYHHVLAQTNGTSSGNVYDGTTNTSASVHPSEPNYVWMEVGNNMSKYDDNEPYGSGNSVLQIFNYATNHPYLTTETLTGLIQQAGYTWKAYTEGQNLLNTNGQNYNQSQSANGLTANPVPSSAWTLPLASFSGTSTNYVNPYNGSHQFNLATKHTGSLFFPVSNGSTWDTANTTTSNVAASHYPPLCQFTNDLTNGTLANYSVITPDQYNDGHNALTLPWTNPETGMAYTSATPNQNDRARVAQMDNFCKIVVGQITNSAVYQAGHTAIIIWTDETETSMAASNGITPQNDFNHTLAEIAISPLCKGHAYNSLLNYTHSSDIATMQKIFGVTASTSTGFINDAANASFSSAGRIGTSQTNGASYSGSPSQASPSTSATFTATAFTQTASPTGGFGTNTALDMSDLFQTGVIPAALPGLPVTASGLSYNRNTHVYSQTVTVSNTLSGTVGNPIYLVVGNLSSNATLVNKTGNTVNNSPGSPYVLVANTLAAGASATVSLRYTVTSGGVASTMSAVTTASQP